MQTVAVIGLGRFGTQLARKLGPTGVQVIAVDRSSHLVDQVKEYVEIAVKLDSTDQAALVSQDIHKADVVVIAIGENFEATLLTTVLLKKLEVPYIICRAQTEFHAEIFRQIGADEVIQPESQTGENLARRLANPHLKDVMALADGYTLIELEAPREFCGTPLYQLELRAKFDVNLVGIKRPIQVEEEGEMVEKQEIISVPRPADPIQPGDVLVLVGSDEALAKLPKE